MRRTVGGFRCGDGARSRDTATRTPRCCGLASIREDSPARASIDDALIRSRPLSSRTPGTAASVSVHVCRSAETLVRTGDPVEHGAPHHMRHAVVAAGVPASVNTTVSTAARVIVLPVTSCAPGSWLQADANQVRLTARTATTMSAMTTPVARSIQTRPADIMPMLPPQHAIIPDMLSRGRTTGRTSVIDGSTAMPSARAL